MLSPLTVPTMALFAVQLTFFVFLNIWQPHHRVIVERMLGEDGGGKASGRRCWSVLVSVWLVVVLLGLAVIFFLRAFWSARSFWSCVVRL